MSPTVLPEALALLPPEMDSREARAMLLAIALQESQAKYHRQIGGPATGLWQFEAGGGVRGVMLHQKTKRYAALVLKRRGVEPLVNVVHAALEHDDILACCFARLLLYVLPQTLPKRHEVDRAWGQYIDAWRPGKPHADKWPKNYADAWDQVGS